MGSLDKSICEASGASGCLIGMVVRKGSRKRGWWKEGEVNAKGWLPGVGLVFSAVLPFSP
jgi:hypothetical protein